MTDGTESVRRRRHRRTVLHMTTVCLTLVALIASGCGSRLSHDRMLADAAGGQLRPESSASAEPVGPQDSPEAGNTQEPAATAAAPTEPALGEAGRNGTGGVAAGAAATGPTKNAAAGARPPGRNDAPASAGVSPAPRGDPAATPNGQNGNPKGGAPSSGTQACSGAMSPIVIGSVGTQSGLLGEVFGAGPKTIQVWVARANAAGGIRCHPIKYIVADDGADPSRHQAEVKRLVEQDRVMAFVYTNAPFTGQASVSYLTQKRIPVIGSETGSPWFYESPMYFPQAPSGDGIFEASFAAAGKYLVSGTGRKLGTISCVEAAVCSRLYDIAPKLAAKYGMNLVYRGQVSLAQPDFTANCQRAQQSGAEIFMIGADANSIKRAVKSCNTVNYKPEYIAVNAGAPIDSASDPSLDGMIVGMNVMPWMVVNHPAVAEFVATLKRYGPGLKPDPTTITAWVAAKLFELATQKLPEPPSTEGILEGLWSIKGNDLGGLTAPLTFRRDEKAQYLPCYWVVQFKDAKIVSPNGGERGCP